MLAKDGVIVGPHLHFDANGTIHFSKVAADEESRFYHLYFDKVAYSDMAIPSPFSVPGIQGFFTDDDLTLVEQGVAQHAGCAPVFGPIEHLNQDAANRMLRATFEYFDAKNPGYWTAAHWDVEGRDSKLPSYDDVYLGLYRILPTPSYATPIHEVLQFKDRRRSELESLREKIDEVYACLASSGDPQRALMIATTTITKDIESVLRCLKESKIRSMLSSIELGFSISPSVIPGLTEAISTAVGLPSSNSLIGAVSIGIGKSIIGPKSNHQKVGPYRLIYRGYKEGVFRDEPPESDMIMSNCKIGQIYVGVGSTFRSIQTAAG